MGPFLFLPRFISTDECTHTVSHQQLSPLCPLCPRPQYLNGLHGLLTQRGLEDNCQFRPSVSRHRPPLVPIPNPQTNQGVVRKTDCHAILLFYQCLKSLGRKHFSRLSSVAGIFWQRKLRCCSLISWQSNAADALSSGNHGEL